MSDLGFNVWGAVAGLIGAVTIIPALLAWIEARFPSRKLPRLLDSLKETQELFSVAVREGLLTDEHDIREFHINIWAANMRVDAIRARVYAEQAWKQDFKNWWKGLSGRIDALCEELNVIRVKLADRNSLERKRLAAEGVAADISWIKECNKHSTHAHIMQCPVGDDCEHRRKTATGLPVPQKGSDRRSYSEEMRCKVQSSVDDEEVGCQPPTLEKPLGPCAQSTHHPISNDDLQSLLSFALSHSARSGDPKGHLDVRDPTPFGNTRRSKPTSRRFPHEAARTPVAALLRLVRRACGIQPRDSAQAGSGSVDVLLDPESLTAHGTQSSSFDGGDWEDV